MGGFRFRKSYKIAPGVKFNIGKKGVGVSVGGKYFRKSINTSGRKTTTVGTPVSGLYYTKTKSANSNGAKKVQVKATPKQQSLQTTAPKQKQPKGTNGGSKKKTILSIVGFLLLFSIILSALLGDSTTKDSISDSTGNTSAVEQLATNDTEQKGDDLWIVSKGRTSSLNNGILQSDAGNWYYVKSGKVQTDYTGVQSNDYGQWYVSNGKVDFAANGLLASGDDQYYIKDGKVDSTLNGLFKTAAGWLMFQNGMVNKTYEGIQQNDNGTWFVRDGQVQFGYNGPYYSDGRTYDVSNGKAYLREETTAAPATKATYSDTEEYVGNSGTYKFHRAGCRAIKEMNQENIMTGHSKEWYLNNGFEPCGICHP